MLTKENHDLRAANKKQKQKRQRLKKQLSYKGGISVLEARESINRQNQADKAINSGLQESREMALQGSARALPRYSDCNTLGHKRTRCPNRVRI